MKPKRVLLAAASALLAGLFIRYGSLRGEDFMYYYCAGWVRNAGRSPYDPSAFQACIAQALGSDNANISRNAGSAYPPVALPWFSVLAKLPFGAAFRLWNALLLSGCLAAGWILLLDHGPAAPLLLVSSPGFILSLAYHKLNLLMFPCVLWAARWIEKDRWLAAGLLFPVLLIQPQWAACLGMFLLLRCRWRSAAVAIGAAAVCLLLQSHDLEAGIWSEWFLSIRRHSDLILSLDNQSLFVALYKPFRFIFPGPTLVLQTIRYACSAVLAAAAFLYCARRQPGTAFPGFLALVVLALPYSHGSDALWSLPALLTAFGKFNSDSRNLYGKTLLRGLSLHLLAAVVLGGYAPTSVSRASYQYLEGYWTLLATGLFAALAPGLLDVRRFRGSRNPER